MAKQISALPTAPSTQRPATFNTEADAFVAALPTFVSEANALATEAATNAQRSEDANATAQSAKDAAQASAQTASEAKEAAARSASEAQSSAQAAAQIKEQTQEIKQSAQEALAAFADAAQSSAQAARQSEQAAEQTKAELQTATNTLEQMKNIVKDGFIDDTAQSETKTYSSKKITELNETLKTDVDQKLDQTGKEIRTAAMSGAMPSAYESDLAMWDYMEYSSAYWGNNATARFFKDWAIGVEKAIGIYTLYPILDKKMKNSYFVSRSDQVTAILDGSGEAIAAIAGNGTIYKQDGTTTYLNATNPDGVSISTSNKVDSVAGKFVLYRLNEKDVAVFGLSSDDKVLKYLYKTSVADISSGYVFHDVLVINKSQAPQKTYKITNTSISEITGVSFPAAAPQYSTAYVYTPFYRDFLLVKNALVKPDGTLKDFPIFGGALGFLGGTPYLIQRANSTSSYVPSRDDGYTYILYDVENGSRGVLLPLGKVPITAYIEDGYAYIVLTDGIIKIPAKYLTGANYKGE